LPFSPLAVASWSWMPSLVGWAPLVQNTRVAPVADLRVDPTSLAGFSITFWTTLIGAPPSWAQIVQITVPGTDGRWPGIWFSPSGALHIPATTINSAGGLNGNDIVESSILSGAYNQRMLVGACFVQNGVIMRFSGVGGFSLTQTRTFASGNLSAFPATAWLHVSGAG
jgi:hypothetical protein